MNRQAVWMVVGATVILVAGLIGLSLYSAGTGGPDLAGIPTTAGGVALEPQLAALIETGDLRFTYKDMVLDMHKPYAQWAAEAAHCAADQGRFWDYRHLLFTDQQQWTKARLKGHSDLPAKREDCSA